MNIVIAKFNKKSDADNLAKYARRLSCKIMILNEGQWEDFILGKLIDESEKEGGDVPIEKILLKLQK